MRLWAPIATFLAALPGGAAAGCRLALALGLDVSGSVDSTEYRLQMDGLAGALMHPEVRMAMLSLPGQRVEMMVYEWSGPADQHVVQDWREVRDEAALADIAATLRRTTRAQGDPSTAIGAAMRAGAAQLGKRGHCDHRVLDLSGDGPSNTGPLPQAVRDSAAMGDVTVNGLVIEEVPPRAAVAGRVFPGPRDPWPGGLYRAGGGLCRLPRRDGAQADPRIAGDDAEPG